MVQIRLNEEMEEKAKNELGETEEVRESGLKEIKEWLKEKNFSREFLSTLLLLFVFSNIAVLGTLGLLNFLRGCKFDQERTREKLSHYLSAKSSKCDVIRNRDPCSEELEEVLTKGMLLFLSSPNLEMLLIRWENCDTKKVSLVNVIKVGLMMFEILINESHTCMVHGHTIVIDCKNLPFGYMRQLSPSLIRDLTCIILKGYPVRIKAVHVINCFPFMSLIFSMFKPFLPLKIISRVRFYSSSNANDLYAHIPLAELPEEYGGEAKSVDFFTNFTRKSLEEKRDWFLKQEGRIIDDKDNHRGFRQLLIN